MNVRALPSTALKPEFETFLFASIGEDDNGMSLSVLSGLARLKIDPWLEAAELGRLPGKAALERLTSLIQALSGDAHLVPDAQAVAKRLLGSLPGKLAENADSSREPAGSNAIMKSQSWWIYILAICFVLGSQIMTAKQRHPLTADQPVTGFHAGNAPPHPPIDLGQ
jgi:hypothetical protein